MTYCRSLETSKFETQQNKQTFLIMIPLNERDMGINVYKKTNILTGWYL